VNRSYSTVNQKWKKISNKNKSSNFNWLLPFLLKMLLKSDSNDLKKKILIAILLIRNSFITFIKVNSNVHTFCLKVLPAWFSLLISYNCNPKLRFTYIINKEWHLHVFYSSICFEKNGFCYNLVNKINKFSHWKKI